MMENEKKKKEEIGKNKKTISILKKIITILIVTPFMPIFLLVSLIISARVNSDTISVDKRFALSSSIEPPYTDTLRNAYDYSFAFCGDPHMLSEGDGCFPELDKCIRSSPIKFAVFGGDLTFLGKEAEYKNFVDHVNALTVPSYAALGNHDLYNNGWENYWRNLGPSSYSFYGGNAKFVVIDTASGEIGQAQMEWIHKELKENKQPLLFVVSHMPIYGGSHDSYEFPKTEEREELIGLFEKYEVDCVFEGHYHGYVELDINGVRYVTSGSFSEGLLDSGLRHFLMVHIYGPDLEIEQVIVDRDASVEYRDGEV